jgi:hypothetical protein
MPIDKDKLYGQFEKSVERREKLYDDLIRKANDIPVDEDVQIENTTKTTNYNGLGAGMSTLGKIGIAAALATGIGMPIGLGFAVPAFLSQPKSHPSSQNLPDAPQKPQSEWRLRIPVDS